MIPLVNLRGQSKAISRDVDRAVKTVLANGNFILGREVDDFERSFAAFCGVKECIGVASGTDALLLSLRALGVGPGDEVITAANTFIATVLPITYLGARPILVDINAITYQIDVEKLEKAITSHTKVIIPVHLYGIPAPIDEIMRIARRHKLLVLEDACQAHGSSLDGKMCGSFGDIAAFSFYPGKNLGAGGDGGAIVTNKKTLADQIRMIRNVGQSQKYKHDVIGYNSRLDTLQASILSVKLKRLENWNNKRRKIASLYNKLLANTPVVLPPQLDKRYKVNYHLYVIRIPKRDNLLEYLKNKGVFCGIHYPIPLHLQKAMRWLNYRAGNFPITEKYAKELLSLPMYPELTEKEVKYICSSINNFFKQKR